MTMQHRVALVTAGDNSVLVKLAVLHREAVVQRNVAVNQGSVEREEYFAGKVYGTIEAFAAIAGCSITVAIDALHGAAALTDRQQRAIAFSKRDRAKREAEAQAFGGWPEREVQTVRDLMQQPVTPDQSRHDAEGGVL